MTALKTFSPRPRDIERRWYVVDADGVVLGRLASEVAKILRGKHKPIFAPHTDTGDHVIVVNARGVRLTGGKETEKIYYRHSGYPGGLREVDYAKLLEQRPVVAVEKAIKGMLPKNRLGRAMARKLSVYEGADHPHRAQKPESLRLGEIPKWEGLPQRKQVTAARRRERRLSPAAEDTSPKTRRARPSRTAKQEIPAASGRSRRARAVMEKAQAARASRRSRKKES